MVERASLNLDMSKARAMRSTELTGQIDILIEAMTNEGMCFIVGYIPLVDTQQLAPAFNSLFRDGSRTNFHNAEWTSEPSVSAERNERAMAEFVDQFRKGSLPRLSFDYERELDQITLSFRLLIDKVENGASVEILCRREVILECSDHVAAVKGALGEFQNLYEEFAGNALFFGPDNLDYPESPQVIPPQWAKIAER